MDEIDLQYNICKLYYQWSARDHKILTLPINIILPKHFEIRYDISELVKQVIKNSKKDFIDCDSKDHF